MVNVYAALRASLRGRSVDESSCKLRHLMKSLPPRNRVKICVHDKPVSPHRGRFMVRGGVRFFLHAIPVHSISTVFSSNYLHAME